MVEPFDIIVKNDEFNYFWDKRCTSEVLSSARDRATQSEKATTSTTCTVPSIIIKWRPGEFYIDINIISHYNH